MLEYRVFVRQTANPLSNWMEWAAFRTQIDRDRYQERLVIDNPTWAVTGMQPPRKECSAGEWVVSKRVDGPQGATYFWITDTTPLGLGVGRAYGDSAEEAEANARVMSASKELQDAARIALAFCDAALDGRLEDVAKTHSNVAELLSAAIAKAEGR